MNYQENSNIPHWARNIDNFGKKRWHKDHPKHTRKGEYIGNFIANLIFLWVVNKVPDWNLGFIRDNYNVVLWVLNMNIFVQLAGNALVFLTTMASFRYFSRIIMEIASFISQIVLFYIYPFDFSNFHGLYWLDWFIPIMLIVGMVVSALKVFSNLWKLLFWRG